MKYHWEEYITNHTRDLLFMSKLSEQEVFELNMAINRKIEEEKQNTIQKTLSFHLGLLYPFLDEEGKNCVEYIVNINKIDNFKPNEPTPQ